MIDTIEIDILKNNSMVNLAGQSKNLSRDRTVNPVMKRKNKLMGLESLNDINYQKEKLLNESYQEKRIGEIIRRKRNGDYASN